MIAIDKIGLITFEYKRVTYKEKIVMHNIVEPTEFSSAFYADENETINLRTFGAKGSQGIPARTYTTTINNLAKEGFPNNNFNNENKNSGIYFVVNSGGNKDENITRYNAFFTEIDDKPMAEQHQLFDECPIKPSIRVETKKSVHSYWLIDGDCSESEWRDIQARLIAYFKGDKSIKNPSRTMRLPFFNHVSFDKETKEFSYKKVEIVDFQPEKRFTVEEMKQVFPIAEISDKSKSKTNRDNVTGCDNVTSECTEQSYETWTELNTELGMRIMQKGRKNTSGKYEMKCPVHKGESETSLFFAPDTKATKCMAECPHSEILKAFGLPTEPKGKEPKANQSALLVNFTNDAELFTSQNDEPFISINVNGHIENWEVDSKTFKDWLGRRFYQTYGNGASENAVKEALSTLSGKAKFDGETKQVFVRRAEFEGAIYLDLVNDDWKVIKITSDGWEIISDCPVKFRRTRGMKSLPLPEKGGSLNDLDKFLNIYDDDLKLVKVWLMTTLKTGIHYPVLVFSSQQNCGKSTSASVLCKMIDPNLASLVAKPRGIEDLFISVSNRLLVAFDNLSFISDELSDALCLVATGGSFTKRKNYSDSDEVILTAKNPLILTGIGDIATKGDLLSRSIIINLPTITNSKRTSESEFWKEFDKVQPRILGALLDAVSEGLKNFYFVEVKDCEARMLDFVKFGSAIETTLGLEKGDFVNLCNKNYENANNVAIENNPVAILINQFMQDTPEWIGSASDLLTKIYVSADEMTRKNPAFPKSPQKLSIILDRLAPNLRLEGIEIEKGEHLREGGTGKRRIKITKVGFGSSQSSQTSQDFYEKEEQTLPFI
jgi:hypothetical protein